MTINSKAQDPKSRSRFLKYLLNAVFSKKREDSSNTSNKSKSQKRPLIFAIKSATEAGSMLLRSITQREVFQVLRGSALVVAFSHLMVAAHYKFLGFEVINLYTDPAITVQSFHAMLVISIAAIACIVITGAAESLFSAKQNREETTEACGGSKFSSTFGGRARETLAAIFIISAIAMSLLTWTRSYPLTIAEDYCTQDDVSVFSLTIHGAVAFDLSPLILPLCQDILYSPSDDPEQRRFVKAIPGVYEVGRFGSVALFIQPSTQARAIFETKSITATHSAGLLIDSQPRDRRLDELGASIGETNLALGVEPYALSCLSEAIEVGKKIFAFQFAENSTAVCLTDQTPQCAENQGIAKKNSESIGAFEASVADLPDGFQVAVFGAASASGSGLGNLKISGDRAAELRQVLEARLATKSPMFTSTALGEAWRHNFTLAQISGNLPSAFVTVCDNTSDAVGQVSKSPEIEVDGT